MKNITQMTQQERDQAQQAKKKDIADFIAENTTESNYLKLVPPMYQKMLLDLFRGKNSKATALKAKCLDCSCYQKEEITNCPVKQCPLWNFRPYQKK